VNLIGVDNSPFRELFPITIPSIWFAIQDVFWIFGATGFEPATSWSRKSADES
jgi:hypothetical protein